MSWMSSPSAIAGRRWHERWYTKRTSTHATRQCHSWGFAHEGLSSGVRQEGATAVMADVLRRDRAETRRSLALRIVLNAEIWIWTSASSPATMARGQPHLAAPNQGSTASVRRQPLRRSARLNNDHCQEVVQTRIKKREWEAD